MGQLTGLAGLKQLQAQYQAKAAQADNGLRVNFECSICEDLQWIGQPARPCECMERKRKARMLAALTRAIGDAYAPYTLENLVALPSRHWKQNVIIQRMRQEPDARWAFFGTQGIGKTLFAFVLARHAIEQGRFVVATTLKDLLDDLRDWQFNEDVKPAITADTLRDAKTSWCIFVDDIGAMNSTPYAVQEWLSIVNAIYSTDRHQLIVTSMSSEQVLRQHYEKAGDGLGVAILRRILDMPNVLKPTQLFDLHPPKNLKLVQSEDAA